jgi:hypothetical protein
MICENNNPLDIDCSGQIRKIFFAPVNDVSDSMTDFKKVAECPHIMEIKTGTNYKGQTIEYVQCKMCDAFEVNF